MVLWSSWLSIGREFVVGCLDFDSKCISTCINTNASLSTESTCSTMSHLTYFALSRST
jgi:hypothetical protein